MQLSRPGNLGVPRETAWVPTDDPSKRRGFDPGLFAGGRWTPAGLSALGHQFSINIASGGLTITTSDLGMPYYALGLGASRSFDTQEQHAQQTFLASHPNADPRIHLFGNWQSSREALVSEVWSRTLPELLVSDGGGDSSNYYRAYPDFDMNQLGASAVEDRLRSYGVAGRTLAALGWSYNAFDCVLRSRQGGFSVLTGDFRAETMVDPAMVRLFRFDPISGSGARYSSEFAYQQLIGADGQREVTVGCLLVSQVDALGHRIDFGPLELQPPYRSYRLKDGSGRGLRFELEDHVDYLDGDHPGGVVRTYVVNRLIDETKTANNVIAYRYQGGRLVEVAYPGHAGGPARVCHYDYDEQNRIVAITDPAGDRIGIEYVEDLYDADDRLVPRLKISRLIDGEGNQVRYVYNHAAMRVDVTFTGVGGDVRTHTFEYLSDGSDTRQRYITSRQIKVERGISGTQLVTARWNYGDDGRYLIQSVEDALGGTSRYEYNAFNQITRKLDAAGHAREFTYDLSPAPARTSPHRYDLIRTSEDNIDGSGNSFDVVSEATFGRYDASSSSDPADAAQSTHRTATRTDPRGTLTRFDYDDAGSFLPLEATETSDVLGTVAVRSYDNRGQCLSETDGEGSTQTFSYNDQGQTVVRTDANGNRRSWVYDAGTGWMTDVTDALGAGPGDPAHSYHYEWTVAGQISKAIDPTGATIAYAYAANKRLRSVSWQDPPLRTISFAYDALGAVTAIADPGGHTTYFDIDEAGRVFSTYRDDPAESAIQTRFDLAGRPVAVTDRAGSTLFGYDAVGRLVSIQEPDWPADSPTHSGKRVTIDYDRLGRRLRVADSELPGEIRYTYDAAGNLTAAQEPFGPLLTSTYDARNLLSQIGDGASIGLEFSRDLASRLTRVTDAPWQDPPANFDFIRTSGALVDNLYRIEGPVVAVDFEYDANRRLLHTRALANGHAATDYGYDFRADGLVSATTGDHSGSYAYDGMKRLIEETDAGCKSGYDAAGNRLWRANHPPPPADRNSYDAANRLLQTPADDTSYSYDANGNLVGISPAAGAATRFSYDGANRLRRVERGALRVDYLYDINGRLLERARTDGTTTKRHRYLYSNRALLAELDDAGQPATVYTRDDDGRLLRRRSTKALHPTPAHHPHSLFYLADGFNDIVRLVDGGGATKLSVDYDAWGKRTVSGTATGELFGYRGGFTDPDLDLVCFGRRWYVPHLGRWLSQDPLLNDVLAARRSAGPWALEIANLYLYVGNNPLNFVDPSGLGVVDWLKNRAREVLVKVMTGRDVDAIAQKPKPTPVERAKKATPEVEEDEATQRPPEEEPEPGAGEGSRSPSSERTYERQAREAEESSSHALGIGAIAAGIGIGIWEGVKWGGAILAAPETGGASLAGAAVLP